MKVGIPTEIFQGEKRVAATAETVKKLIAAGFEVLVQKGAGRASAILDEDYLTAGAKLQADSSFISSVDVILKVRKPIQNEIDFYREGAILVALIQPFDSFDLIQKLAKKNITTIAMEMVPRIARAQKLDALSSQSNVAGYKAVLMAANYLGTMMPMLMTAAGTISAGKVLVLGAGVAGLQAIATAKRLGAIVEAFDVRPAVKDQVESLGAKFLQIELESAQTEDVGGYAKELSEEQHRKELELIGSRVKISNIIITTALIPGRPAPKLITEEMVKSMSEGSVIIDLAAEGGGNCELTEPGKVTIQHGVTIVGELNFPSLMAPQSSQLYARNILNLIMDHQKEGRVELDLEDEIIQGALLTHKGNVVHSVIKERLSKSKGL